MSFLEKLKKNIGIEEESSLIKTSEDKEPSPPAGEAPEDKEKPKSKKKKVKVKEEIKETIIEDKKSPSSAKAPEGKKEKWFEQKGELAVDVYQTKTDLVIQSAVAGVKPENLDIVIENDILTIEGNREKLDEDEEKNYFYQECYWGPFYKRIILQEEVDNSRVEAMMKNGILTIRIPKIQRKRKRKVVVKV